MSGWLALVAALGVLFVALVLLALVRRRGRRPSGPAFPLTDPLEDVVMRVAWPELPRLERRPNQIATRDDVKRGHAVFAMEALGIPAGSALAVPLPQYGFHVDKDVRRPVIVTQAEVAGNGLEIWGYQSLDGKSFGAVLRKELELLGQQCPPQVGAVAASEEQAVLVFLDGVNLPDEVYESCDTSTLEDLLQPTLESTGAGVLDGFETGPSETCMFLYGPDAERLFAVIEPVLREYPLCSGARAVIRQGGPGAPEREVRLPLSVNGQE